MRRAILSQIGDRHIAELTREPNQVALNQMAAMPLVIGRRKETQRRVVYRRIGDKAGPERTCGRRSRVLRGPAGGVEAMAKGNVTWKRTRRG